MPGHEIAGHIDAVGGNATGYSSRLLAKRLKNRLGERIFRMIDPPFRSPRERVGGLYHFGRMLDKIRCHLREKLPEEYRPNFGWSVGLDGMLGVTHAELIERMRDGGSDEEILESDCSVICCSPL